MSSVRRLALRSRESKPKISRRVHVVYMAVSVVRGPWVTLLFGVYIKAPETLGVPIWYMP